MQAIQTTYFGPSNARGARIKVISAGMTRTFSYEHGLNLAANHRYAAVMVQMALGWNAPGYGTLVSGWMADGSYVHVLSGRDGKGDI